MAIAGGVGFTCRPVIVGLALASMVGCSGPDALESEAVADPATSSIAPYNPRLGRDRPVIAVLAFNPSTELTDYVVPYAVLKESDVADVHAVALTADPVRTSPALRFGGHSTIADFDARYPDGADYVIVPNIYEGEDDPIVLQWIRGQAAAGATIVGICDGVPTIANAGVLNGRRATTHWRTIDRMREEHPEARWTRNQRYVVDGNVITTSGVSASIPISMALVEAIGGQRRAAELGAKLGISDWGPAHDSDRFRLDAGSIATVLRNQAMFWRHEELGVTVAPGIDDIRLALIADTYGRTRRSTVTSFAASPEPVPTLYGLTVIPDRTSGEPDRMLPLFENAPPLEALDRSLEDIEQRYGDSTADFVALTMEYARES